MTTTDGTTREALVPLAKGKPERWPTPSEVEAKFRDCAGVAMDREAQSRLLNRLRALDALPDLREIATLVSEGVRHG